MPARPAVDRREVIANLQSGGTDEERSAGDETVEKSAIHIGVVDA